MKKLLVFTVLVLAIGCSNNPVVPDRLSNQTINIDSNDTLVLSNVDTLTINTDSLVYISVKGNIGDTLTINCITGKYALSTFGGGWYIQNVGILNYIFTNLGWYLL